MALFSSSGPGAERLAGVLERIIFFNEENHYTIAEFRPEEPEAASKTGKPARAVPAPKPPAAGGPVIAPGRVVIVGALPGVQCGETLQLRGQWTRHAQHGEQFKVEGFSSELPASVYGIRKYLGSGLVPGIGKIYANKIVDAFGTDTFRVISEESAKLRAVPGIGRSRAQAIKRAWEEQRALREVLIFLQTYGVTPAQCLRLVKQYGGEAKTILKTEPYRVAREIDGIGFKTADRLALNLGYANDAAPRLDSGLLHAMAELEEEGHTAAPESLLRDHAAELLQTEPARLEARIEALVESKQLVRAEGEPRGAVSLLQLPVTARAERKIADALARLLRSPSGLPSIKVEPAVAWAQQKAGFTFGDQQAVALRAALSVKVSVLTGGPGTGKTTILRALVEILRAKKCRVHLAAPTGRAAQRLSQATGGFAQTLHRLLKYDGANGFGVSDQRPLATDFLIVDEASMLDTRLASAVVQAVPSGSHLLLVGDVDQLPSVGPGEVLKNLIEAGAELPGLSTTRLSVIYRQKDQSPIVTTAHAINAGDSSLPPAVREVDEIPVWRDLTFVIADSPEEGLRKTVDLCARFIPQKLGWFHPVNEVQVLAPMHKGLAGVANLNAQLQAALNRGTGGEGGDARARPRAGDKVIQLRNNYDKGVFNGDIGSVAAAGDAGELTVDFDGDRQVYERGDQNELSLAYAISIHKSQGSEYPVVVIPLFKAHFMMLQRNLVYTAVTRGKKRVFLVGEPAAYAMAVRTADSRQRRTHLREKLLAAMAETR